MGSNYRQEKEVFILKKIISNKYKQDEESIFQTPKKSVYNSYAYRNYGENAAVVTPYLVQTGVLGAEVPIYLKDKVTSLVTNNEVVNNNVNQTVTPDNLNFTGYKTEMDNTLNAIKTLHDNYYNAIEANPTNPPSQTEYLNALAEKYKYVDGLNSKYYVFWGQKDQSYWTDTTENMKLLQANGEIINQNNITIKTNNQTLLTEQNPTVKGLLEQANINLKKTNYDLEKANDLLMQKQIEIDQANHQIINYPSPSHPKGLIYDDYLKIKNQYNDLLAEYHKDLEGFIENGNTDYTNFRYGGYQNASGELRNKIDLLNLENPVHARQAINEETQRNLAAITQNSTTMKTLTNTSAEYLKLEKANNNLAMENIELNRELYRLDKTTAENIKVHKPDFAANVGVGMGLTVAFSFVGAFLAPFITVPIAWFANKIRNLFRGSNNGKRNEPIKFKFKAPQPKNVAFHAGIASCIAGGIRGGVMGATLGPWGIIVGVFLGCVAGLVTGAVGGFLGAKLLEKIVHFFKQKNKLPEKTKSLTANLNKL